MTIADQITRLNNAKAAIKQSIIRKGIPVSDSALLDEYAALIDIIVVGGSEGGNESYYEDLFNAITNNNTDYSYLFHNGIKTSLDISSFDTSNVTTMYSMFYNCSNLTSIDLSNFNTSKVTDMRYMFYDCHSLTSLDLSNFDTSKVTDMSNMFDGCVGLTSLDVNNLDTSNVTDMSNMFDSCNSLTSIDVSNFDTSNVTDMNYAFQYCSKLTSLDLSNWDAGRITSDSSFQQIIRSCSALVDFKAPKNIKVGVNVSTCNALSHDSLMSIINNLNTVTSTKTLNLGSTNLAKLTDDEKAIATGKGWTVK